MPSIYISSVFDTAIDDFTRKTIPPSRDKVLTFFSSSVAAGLVSYNFGVGVKPRIISEMCAFVAYDYVRIYAYEPRLTESIEVVA